MCLREITVVFPDTAKTFVNFSRTLLARSFKGWFFVVFFLMMALVGIYPFHFSVMTLTNFRVTVVSGDENEKHKIGRH